MYRKQPKSVHRPGTPSCPWFLVFGLLCRRTAWQLATQLQQRCIQVVCSNKEARKRLTESNGTPAMDPGHIYVVLKKIFAYASTRRVHVRAVSVFLKI